MILKPSEREMDRKQRLEYLLNAPADEIFTFSRPTFDLPERARLFDTVICQRCGEGAPSIKCD